MSDAQVARAIAAVRVGGVVVLPTDTVYGLVADARDAAAATALYRLKGRASVQPTAVLASSVAAVRGLVPLDRRAAAVADALLPGPYTLVVANPAQALPWLCGPGATTIGVRVPLLPIVNPPVWELSHIAWFQERWCLRYSPRTQSLERPSLLEGADAFFDSSAVPHDTRWTLPYPPLAELLRYMERTLEGTLAALERVLRTATPGTRPPAVARRSNGGPRTCALMLERDE